jgi:hypothetical protein
MKLLISIITILLLIAPSAHARKSRINTSSDGVLVVLETKYMHCIIFFVEGGMARTAAPTCVPLPVPREDNRIRVIDSIKTGD